MARAVFAYLVATSLCLAADGFLCQCPGATPGSFLWPYKWYTNGTACTHTDMQPGANMSTFCPPGLLLDGTTCKPSQHADRPFLYTKALDAMLGVTVYPSFAEPVHPLDLEDMYEIVHVLFALPCTTNKYYPAGAYYLNELLKSGYWDTVVHDFTDNFTLLTNGERDLMEERVRATTVVPIPPTVSPEDPPGGDGGEHTGPMLATTTFPLSDTALPTVRVPMLGETYTDDFWMPIKTVRYTLEEAEALVTTMSPTYSYERNAITTTLTHGVCTHLQAFYAPEKTDPLALSYFFMGGGLVRPGDAQYLQRARLALAFQCEYPVEGHPFRMSTEALYLYQTRETVLQPISLDLLTRVFWNVSDAGPLYRAMENEAAQKAEAQRVFWAYTVLALVFFGFAVSWGYAVYRRSRWGDGKPKYHRMRYERRPANEVQHHIDDADDEDEDTFSFVSTSLETDAKLV